MVNFAGIDFIFRFLPFFLLIYCLTPSRYRDAVLFAGSLVFYASGARFFVLLLLAHAGTGSPGLAQAAAFYDRRF